MRSGPGKNFDEGISLSKGHSSYGRPTVVKTQGGLLGKVKEKIVFKKLKIYMPKLLNHEKHFFIRFNQILMKN